MTMQKKKRHKHKKKHHHKKHKKKHGEGDEMVNVDGQWQRRESEQVNIDDEDIDELSDEQPYHVPVGGKRPFAALHASEAQEDQDDEDADARSRHNTRLAR